MKKVVTAVLVAGMLFMIAGCKKKEQAQQLPPGHPSMEGMTGAGAPKADRKVVVSKAVKAKWTAVKLVVDDKNKKSSKEYTVKVGSSLAVPNTKLDITVLAFLPHFQMTDSEIVSASNEAKMPAAQIVVKEAGKPEWKGWVFSLQPDMHPFMHEQYAIKLAGGVSN